MTYFDNDGLHRGVDKDIDAQPSKFECRMQWSAAVDKNWREFTNYCDQIKVTYNPDTGLLRFSSDSPTSCIAQLKNEESDDIVTVTLGGSKKSAESRGITHWRCSTNKDDPNTAVNCYDSGDFESFNATADDGKIHTVFTESIARAKSSDDWGLTGGIDLGFSLPSLLGGIISLQALWLVLGIIGSLLVIALVIFIIFKLSTNCSCHRQTLTIKAAPQENVDPIQP